VQVGSSNLPALPIATDYRRRDDYERAPRARQVEPEQPQPREVTRIRTRAGNGVERTEQSAPFAENVTARNRPALQSYQSNGPTIEERLGVDLAGIDVYA
jgi:hypothetical protein